MKRSIVPVIVVFLAATLLVGNAMGQVLTVKKPVLVKPLFVNGEVSVILGSHGPIISPYFNIRIGTKPARDLIVMLNGHRLRETMPGQYAGISITSITPAPGGTLTFTVEKKKKLTPGTVGLKPARIQGTAVIGSLITITNPAEKSEWTSKTIGKSLAITWTGGKPVFSAALVKTTGGSPLELFSRNGLLMRSCPVPGTLMAPGNTYSAVVSCNMGNFVLSKIGSMPGITLDKSSRVSLRHSALNRFVVR